MKLTSRDFRSLRQAANVADAQKELVELEKWRSDHVSDQQSWRDPAAIGVVSALAVVLIVTLSTLA
jgi:hypothetical protein